MVGQFFVYFFDNSQSFGVESYNYQVSDFQGFSHTYDFAQAVLMFDVLMWSWEDGDNGTHEAWSIAF